MTNDSTPLDVAAELMRLATEATPGPWRDDFGKEQDHSNASYVTSLPLEKESDGTNALDFAVVGSIWYDGPNTVITKENAAYIAACSPERIIALCSALSEATAHGERLGKELEEAKKDSSRLEWLQQEVDGSGETLLMGGVCHWSIAVQTGGPRSKVTRLGDGDDLRDAIDDAVARAAASPTGEPA